MKRRSAGVDIVVCEGNICEAETESIVNAANEGLRHSGGVAKAICTAGGPQIQKESDEWVKSNERCHTGIDAAVTTAGTLFDTQGIKKVIHVVGPNLQRRTCTKLHEDQLAGAVTAAMEKADELGLLSIAIPTISGKIFQFPIEKCAKIHLESAIAFSKQAKTLKVIQFIDLDKDTVKAFEKAFEEASFPDEENATVATDSSVPCAADGGGGASSGQRKRASSLQQAGDREQNKRRKPPEPPFKSNGEGYELIDLTQDSD